ncbi:mammalian ependymin-related protein 1 [Etheostoma cragini]|uniref:mammalian ependymin-related protein 1 n=1 Tax=Etheostoma cragini TaxID=417921 RepID=UPI00155E96B2|nr:mammalian ependymin-related protein 1 [Etheostoma cragini]
MHRVLLVLLAAAGASVLGPPRLDGSPAAGPCLAPPQWEGSWVLYDHSTGRNNRAAVSYDGLNHRIRILQQNKKHTPCQNKISPVVLVSPPDETWVGTYTVKDCYPVQETYVRNSSVTTSTRFFNLRLGISDPDVFTPPSTCQSARPERMAESTC